MISKKDPNIKHGPNVLYDVLYLPSLRQMQHTLHMFPNTFKEFGHALNLPGTKRVNSQHVGFLAEASPRYV